VENQRPEPKRHLCELAQATLKDLQAQGIEPTFDDVCWINDLARLVAKPNGGENRHLAGAPSKAGSVWLWPFTIQGERWYKDCALGWFEADMEMGTYAFAYALAHGRDPHAFQDLDGYQSAKKILGKFKHELNCTHEELCAAIVDVVDLDDEMEAIQAGYKAAYDLAHNIAPDEDPDIEWSDLIAYLVAATGLPPETWNWQNSRESVMGIMNAVHKQHLAMSGAGSDAPDVQDPYIFASRNLGLAGRVIKDRANE